MTYQYPLVLNSLAVNADTAYVVMPWTVPRVDAGLSVPTCYYTTIDIMCRSFS